MSKGNNSVAFAMMLLQRRLSSSLEAVHLSLERRRNKLEQLLAASLEERRKYYRHAGGIDIGEIAQWHPRSMT